jgi:uncharacterized protein (TIGR03084 family)
MMTLNAMIADLESEQQSLDQVIADLDDATWRLSTDSPGWTIADQVSHLQFFDERAALAMTNPDAFVVDRQHLISSAPRDLSIELGRQVAPDELLQAWRLARLALIEAATKVDPTVRVPWYGPSMAVKSFLTARLMECWAHGHDVAEAIGVQRSPSARLKHVAHIGVGARAFSLLINQLPEDSRSIRVELNAPDGDLWTWGDETSDQRVLGDALDFCLVVTQRRALSDSQLTVVGDSATTWMSIAQAFAGAPTRKS